MYRGHLFPQRPRTPWSYPVLARLSESYPSPEGRLSTCYSPVRRFTHPCGFLARLACVRHAASVRSEPGSNSPIKILGALSAPGLTYFKLHSKHCGVPQSSSWTCYPVFKDRAILRLRLRTTFCLPASTTGRATYRCQRFRVKGLRSRPRSRPGSAGAASSNTADRRCQEPAVTRRRVAPFLRSGPAYVTPRRGLSRTAFAPRPGVLGTILARSRFRRPARPAADEVDLLAAARDARLRAHHLHLRKRLPRTAEERLEVAAHEDLHHQRSAGLEDLERERRAPCPPARASGPRPPCARRMSSARGR